VFGFAWTFIMICFTFYIYTVFKVKKSLNLTLTLFILQWFLNILWNPLFFNLHLPVLALLILLLLLITLLVLLVYSEFKLQFQLLILPYVIWLGIAISLNFYIIVNN
jgi:tryptophan-rich sensory protein